jgi:membrane-associated protease RseP (regulator of RpoE activity)
MIRFTIFGIPVEIQTWFWITMVVLGYMQFSKSVDSEMLPLCVSLFVLAGLVSILVHELGHALAGMYFRAKPYIVLQSLGGYAAFPNSQFTRTQSFLVTAAGPAIQVLLGILSYAVLHYFPQEKEMFLLFFKVLTAISILWAILNLVPVFPLDGGRMMFALMGPRREKLAWWISMICGSIAGICFIAYGIFPFMGVMLLFMVFQNYQIYSQTYQ